MRNKRRRLVLGATAFLVVSGIGTWFGSRGRGDRASAPHRRDASRLLTSILSDRHGAKEIGRRYLGSVPAEAEEAVRWAVLTLRSSPPGRASLRATVRGSRERDFQRGNVVLVDGWLLARSEARLCAIAALC